MNIALANTLVEIADQVDLPKDEAREVLDSRRFKDSVDADWQRSRELGVTGVPTFVVGDRTVRRLRPLCHLLGQAAVIRHRAITVVQALIGHQSDHTDLGCWNVDVATGEELLKRETFHRRVGVQRKVPELHVDLVGGAKSFYTHGAEVAPWSDVVGKDFEDDGIGHFDSSGYASTRNRDLNVHL